MPTLRPYTDNILAQINLVAFLHAFATIYEFDITSFKYVICTDRPMCMYSELRYIFNFIKIVIVIYLHNYCKVITEITQYFNVLFRTSCQ